MDYKAFVSSTFLDLQEHRAHVIRELRKAGFFVDPMEEWTSAAQEPKVLSVNRLEGCTLCVLLVARRRGHVPTRNKLSITQQEVAKAKKLGIDVLPFLLDDDALWKTEWDERKKDKQLRQWRADIKDGKCGTPDRFNHEPNSIQISAALVRWVKEKGKGVDRTRIALDLYLKLIEQEHGTIQFLGLPQLKDNPNVSIEGLYVEPALAERQVSPDTDPKDWPPAQPVLDAVAKHQKLVVLGDPGTGKSTLVSWIAWQLARHHHDGASSWTERLGRLVPLPFVLRNLGIEKGVTWDKLLRAFLDQPLATLLELADLPTILKEGRAIIMLDGLDEIGNLAVRRELRDAVWNGMKKLPNCRWLLTSRVVGYDEVSFDWRTARGGGVESWVEEIATQRSVVPFNDKQVDQFAKNWFVAREETEYKREHATTDFLQAIRGHESTRRLGRIPILLTMMALIHRIEATLPHGRARLYAKIAQAYLETIDQWRKLQRTTEEWTDRRKWLARVGFEMQRRRSPKDESSGEILATGDEVRGWIAAAMVESGKQVEPHDAGEFVDYLAKRSGLLLPRGQDQFAFLHLSFQEYFAASLLTQKVVSPLWARGDMSKTPEGARQTDLARYASESMWRETLIFLVELLAAEQPDWLPDVRDCLFGKDLADVGFTPPRKATKKMTEANQNRVVLLARLAIDSTAGFDVAERERAIHACCRWEMAMQKRSEGRASFYFPTVAQTLLAADMAERLAITKWLAEAAQEFHVIRLTLHGTGVSDVGPLAGLGQLQFLDLCGTGVNDVGPLTGLGQLQSLDLCGTGVSDLTPLVGLKKLSAIYLNKGQEVRIPKTLEEEIRWGAR